MLKLIEMFCAKLLSPSVRRAWIEIRSNPEGRFYYAVALREEGVD